MLDGDTSDSMNEGEIVFYHKDDVTKFSEPLGLNKVRRRVRKNRKALSDLPDYDYGERSLSKSSERTSQYPFKAQVSEVDQASSMAEWNLRHHASKNHF